MDQSTGDGSGGGARLARAPGQAIGRKYVPGGSLETWLREEPGRRPQLHKREIIRRVVSALAEAHRQGIYHRDLKAANILLTQPPDVQAKVAGFGLADAEPVSSADFQADPLMASMYWPPEAWGAAAERTEPAGRAGRDPARDDVFALGAIWYQLRVEKLERPPYDYADALAAAGEESHAIRLISRCLARPQRRFTNAVELEAEFGKAVPPETGLPEWPPVPAKYFDVSQIVREYLRGEDVKT